MIKIYADWDLSYVAFIKTDIRGYDPKWFKEATVTQAWLDKWNKVRKEFFDMQDELEDKIRQEMEKDNGPTTETKN